MSSPTRRMKKVEWRSWDVLAVEDKHKINGPLPTANDDYRYVVDNDSSNDYGRFLRLGALIDRRMNEFAGAVCEALEGMADAADSRLNEMAVEVEKVKRGLESATHSYEDLRAFDHKLKLIDSLADRVLALERQARERAVAPPGPALSSAERTTLSQLSETMAAVRRELRDLSGRLDRVETRSGGAVPVSRRVEQVDETVTVARQSSVPAWVVWAAIAVGALLLVDIVTRFLR